MWIKFFLNLKSKFLWFIIERVVIQYMGWSIHKLKPPFHKTKMHLQEKYFYSMKITLLFIVLFNVIMLLCGINVNEFVIVGVLFGFSFVIEDCKYLRKAYMKERWPVLNRLFRKLVRRPKHSLPIHYFRLLSCQNETR